MDAFCGILLLEPCMLMQDEHVGGTAELRSPPIETLKLKVNSFA